MPEEINRLVTDAITSYFFTTSEAANDNLRRSGAPDQRVFFVGNTMIDTLLANEHRLTPPSCWGEHGVRHGGYIVLTLHRPSNVDSPARLAVLLDAIGSAARGLPVLFPVHPRTAAMIGSGMPLPPNIRVLDPQPYLEFNFLAKHARAVVTDSGGITEETTVMGVPCMTLRDTTERPETVSIGTNELLGTDPSALAPAFERLFGGQWKRGGIPEKWDGRAGERIVEVLSRALGS